MLGFTIAMQPYYYLLPKFSQHGAAADARLVRHVRMRRQRQRDAPCAPHTNYPEYPGLVRANGVVLAAAALLLQRTYVTVAAVHPAIPRLYA